MVALVGVILSSAGPARCQERVDLATQAKSRNSEKRMRAAMLSVHALVERERPELREILRIVDPAPLDRIVSILLEDDTPVGKSRRRRAGIRLLALAANPAAADDSRASARVAAKRLLSAEEVEAVLRVTSEIFGDRHCQREDVDVEAVVAELVEETCIGTCCWSGEDPRVYLDGKTINLNMDLEFTGTTMERAAKGLDPQEWHPCSPLWKETWLCKLKPNGNPDESGGVCIEQAVVPSGSDYGGKRVLYEHFQCDGMPCAVRLYLDAKVTFPTPAGSYDFWYSNPRMISGPTIIPDQGGVQMSGTGPLSVHSRKTFGYSNYTDAAVVYSILRKIETTHYLGELVCCH
jgi:hypothetical protein